MSKLREELRQVREELSHQKLESNIRNTDEVRNLHDKVFLSNEKNNNFVNNRQEIWKKI